MKTECQHPPSVKTADLIARVGHYKETPTRDDDEDDVDITMASGSAALGMILEKIASKDKGACALLPRFAQFKKKNPSSRIKGSLPKALLGLISGDRI